MDTIYREQNEDYQVQCGEMFYTTRGRLIFHCTLCENKFNEFSIYESHLKDHIVPNFEYDENEDALDDLEYESVQHTYEDVDAEEIFGDQSCDASTEKIEEETDNIELDEFLAEDKKIVFGESKNFAILENTKTSNTEKTPPETTKIEQYDIPEVTRKVRSCKFPRSALIPEKDRKHKCPVCGAAFKDKNNMLHHLKRHTDKKDHKCPECDKKFYTTSEVRIHLRSHSNERPFLCNICGNSYAHNSRLLAHIRTHTGKKNFSCDICQKAFFDRCDLKRHMAGHSGERPFACEICGADFARPRTLKNHMKLHENKREYKCKLCSCSFNQRAGLTSHLKTAHKMATVKSFDATTVTIAI